MAENDFKKQVLGTVSSSDWLTSIASSYGRRMMEGAYDRISKTQFFEGLKRQSVPAKYFMEAVNNALVAFLEQKIDDGTPLRRVLKDIFMDSSSELNKRLINGEPAKKIIAEEAETGGTSGMNSAEKDFLTMLLTMEDEEIEPFLKWIFSMTDEERLEAIKILRGLSEEDFLKFASVGDEMKKLILESAKEPKKKSLAKEVLKEWLKKRSEERRNRNGRNK